MLAILNSLEGVGLILIVLYTLIFLLVLVYSNKIKSLVINFGVVSATLNLVLWFTGGYFYSALWRTSKYGSLSSALDNLPEFVDESSVGFLIALILSLFFIFWLNKQSNPKNKPKI